LGLTYAYDLEPKYAYKQMCIVKFPSKIDPLDYLKFIAIHKNSELIKKIMVN